METVFLYLAVQLISISCIYHGSVTEAGLLKNETFILYPKPDPYSSMNDSSQIGREKNVSYTGNGNRKEILTSGASNFPEILTSSSISPPENGEVGRSTVKSDEIFQSAEISDVVEEEEEEEEEEEDTYGGVNLEPFPHPVKKFAKYSHQLKYGKIKAGVKKAGEESVEEPEEKKAETIKLLEEKLRINISLAGESSSGPPEVGGNYSSSTSEQPETGNLTREGQNERTDPTGESLPSMDEETMRKEPETKTDNPEMVSSASETNDSETLNVAVDELEPFHNETLVIENKVQESAIRATVESFLLENRVAAATSAQNFEFGQSGLDAGSVTGIALGILVVFGLFGAIFFILYRRRYSNKPQVLHEKCSNLDSSGYIDDTSLRENSEEMYSLDNDSFLNSLEAMTIQNYWTENVKHTKL